MDIVVVKGRVSRVAFDVLLYSRLELIHHTIYYGAEPIDGGQMATYAVTKF